MEEIIESILNGQRRQALKQLAESGLEFIELIEELNSVGDYEEVTRMFRVAIRIGYLVEHEDLPEKAYI